MGNFNTAAPPSDLEIFSSKNQWKKKISMSAMGRRGYGLEY